MTINVARMTDPTLPAVQNFKGRLNFANNALTIEQCRGELSGGHFTVSGRRDLSNVAQCGPKLAVEGGQRVGRAQRYPYRARGRRH